jgi:dihydroflavonol-4-reductase
MSESESTVLVLGASGFLGSHVVKALLAEGRKVRTFVRPTSDTSAIDHLDTERFLGDVRDIESVRAAMEGCGVVYYCVVDARAWLKDPAPLYETNVDALRDILELALDSKVRRFVFTSTFSTIGINPRGVASEADAFNWWDEASDYARVRVRAEELFLSYCRRGLPGVVCNPSFTYGTGDLRPTPHGWMIQMVVEGKMPCHWAVNMPAVGIRDAAQAMLLAERRGRTGERYLITERTLSLEELYNTAAEAVGRGPIRLGVPMPIMLLACKIIEKIAWLLGRETVITQKSLRLMRIPRDFDNEKARTELGWNPRPAAESIRDGARWFRDQRS